MLDQEPAQISKSVSIKKKCVYYCKNDSGIRQQMSEKQFYKVRWTNAISYEEIQR